MAEPSTMARQVWGVAALLLAMGDALAARFGACSVRGELSGFTRAASGHCYFTLKDADGQAAALRCAMFRRAASLVDFNPRDGQQVELRGRIALYEPRGELQFVVEAMQLVGTGSLYEQFLRLKERLQAQGLFDAERKRPLPRFPARVGVVTSLAAAALRDVLTTLARRAPQVEVVIYPSPVQGAEAPAALVAALQLANQRREVDVLILCRGGGSLEDLWAFNEERVVFAVAESGIPLVCGVGHETDVSLADFAADLRAPTPTAAAELVAPAQAEALEQLATLARRMRRQVQRQLERQAQDLDQRALQLARPGAVLARHAQQLDRLEERARHALRHALQRAAEAPQRLAA
uniref:exodeoxyribonuclease VII large subunit n=1 Tax=uncultured Azohydromonas sp. TaxID=487342 RepID=UPI0026054B7F